MATKAWVQDDKFTPYAAGLTVALISVVAVWNLVRAGSDDADPFLPALLWAANGLLLAVRPAAYFGIFAPRWAFEDGERGRPSRAWLVVGRLVGIAVVALAVATVVASRRPGDEGCTNWRYDEDGTAIVTDCWTGLGPGGQHLTVG